MRRESNFNPLAVPHPFASVRKDGNGKRWPDSLLSLIFPRTGLRQLLHKQLDVTRLKYPLAVSSDLGYSPCHLAGPQTEILYDAFDLLRQAYVNFTRPFHRADRSTCPKIPATVQSVPTDSLNDEQDVARSCNTKSLEADQRIV